MDKKFYVYLITNKIHTVLYTGVTSDLVRRVYEHKEKLVDGFSKTYNLEKLVYFEIHSTANDAITREKRIKKWNREWKDKLVNEFNPEWKDLYVAIIK